jgi:plastocyanin domain-containing protein
VTAGSVPAASSIQRITILVGDTGFDPSTVTLRAGMPAQLTFVRTSDKTCATAVTFPSLDIKRALPLNEPMTIDFTPAKAGEVSFACGMNMVKGSLIVR